MNFRFLGILLIGLVVLALGLSYVMAAIPSQPKVDISSAVETAWDHFIEYTYDLTVSETVAVNMGGIDSIRIMHVESADTNSSGIYYPFEIFYVDTSGADSTKYRKYGRHTEYLSIGAAIFKTDQFFLINPSTTETVTVEILLIGE